MPVVLSKMIGLVLRFGNRLMTSITMVCVFAQYKLMWLEDLISS